VVFRNEVDGSEMNLTPERSVQIQQELGADVIRALDECTPWPASETLAGQGVRRTIAWAARCQAAHQRSDQALFAIVQGSTYPALREACAAALVDMDFPGYAIGGVSVGEGHELLCRVTEHAAPLLPEGKPRYLMGVGLPEDLLAAMGYGIDLFDCVIPTRYARSASAFTVRGRIRLTNRRYRRDKYPIDLSCDCTSCAAGFSRAYLNHLFNTNEILGAVLTTIHNVRFYQRLMEGARDAILAGRYDAWRKGFLEQYQGKEEASEAERSAQ
jgi:queuine tRNA-ribosyltransferase